MKRFDPLTEKNLRVSGNNNALIQAREYGIKSDFGWFTDILKELFAEVSNVTMNTILYLESVLFVMLFLIALNLLRVK